MVQIVSFGEIKTLCGKSIEGIGIDIFSQVEERGDDVGVGGFLKESGNEGPLFLGSVT